MLESAALKLFALIWLANWANKQGGGAPAKTPKGQGLASAQPNGGALPVAVPAAPQPWPSTLPQFPDGWEYDTPVPQDVQVRAAALLPSLWAKGAGSTAQEMTGGRWITYEAEMVPGGHQGVTAWRIKGSPAAPAPIPSIPGVPQVVQPKIPVVPSNTPAGPAATAASTSPNVSVPAPLAPALTPLQSAAVAFANALTSNGYRKSDMPLYSAFQRATGVLKADGFPGESTMGALRDQLASLGLPMPSVVIYPWRSTGGYDGKNAPTAAEWNR